MGYESLKNIAGDGNFLSDANGLEPFLTPWRGSARGYAGLVVFPQNTEHLAKIVSYCFEKDIKIVPQGGNTGLVMGTVSPPNSVIINMKNMRKILEVDTVSNVLIADSGVTLHEIQQAAVNSDRLFPLSIASEGSAHIGGCISTNAGGVSVLKYGNMRELVLGLEVVLPTGNIWNGISKLRKDNTGYDLKQFFIGAEGTLGIITKASLRLFSANRQRETALLAVSNISDSINLLQLMQNDSGESVVAFEYISSEAMKITCEIFGIESPIEGTSFVLTEWASPAEGTFIRENLEKTLELAFEKNLIQDGLIAENLTQRKSFWHIREHISEAARKKGRGIHFDISLPTDKIAEFISNMQPEVEKHKNILSIPFGHLGDGNLHYNFVYNGSDNIEFEKIKKFLKEAVYNLLKKYNGSFSAEHGIGIERMMELEEFEQPNAIELMRNIKKSLDPKNIMNTGKVFF
jgi:FAD/FMN-containing dehydrogenase